MAGQKKEKEGAEGYLGGRLLVAMPGIRDPRFERSVVYLCAHNAEGAMGLIINRLVENLSFPELMAQLNLGGPGQAGAIRIHAGGPVETGRGFVLHSSDYVHGTTLRVDQEVALTATVDILRDIAFGRGPRHSFLALGYAGWGPGQLDREIQANGWLVVGSDEALLFDEQLGDKWERAIAKLGISPLMLSDAAGHA